MNVVILSGRIGRIDFRAGVDGKTAVVNYSVAIDRRGQKGETDWINCVSFGKTADFLNQYFIVGKPIEVTGSVRSNSYTDKDGNKRNSQSVVGESLGFVLSDNKAGGEATTPSTTSAPAASEASQPSDQVRMDDIPF